MPARLRLYNLTGTRPSRGTDKELKYTAAECTDANTGDKPAQGTPPSLSEPERYGRRGRNKWHRRKTSRLSQIVRMLHTRKYRSPTFLREDLVQRRHSRYRCQRGDIL